MDSGQTPLQFVVSTVHREWSDSKPHKSHLIVKSVDANPNSLNFHFMQTCIYILTNRNKIDLCEIATKMQSQIDTNCCDICI